MHRVSVEPVRLQKGEGSLLQIEGPEGVSEYRSPLSPDALPLDGQTLTDSELQTLLEGLEKAAMEYGAKMLALRLMSRGMLESRMAEAGYDPEMIRRAADRFEALGALDDGEYARLFSADRAARGWGAVRIAGELRRRKLDEETINWALKELDAPAEEIERFLRQRTGGEPVDRKTADKLGAVLVRKGFRWEDIRPVLHRYTRPERDYE